MPKSDREKMLELLEDLDIEAEVSEHKAGRSTVTIRTGGDAWTEFKFDEAEVFDGTGTYLVSRQAKPKGSIFAPPPIQKAKR